LSSSDWRAIGAAGTVIGLIVMAHGITSGRWQRLHTIGMLLTAAAFIGPRVVK
jgi:hypothetical protein